VGGGGGGAHPLLAAPPPPTDAFTYLCLIGPGGRYFLDVPRAV
jgi:hypothetical protein